VGFVVGKVALGRIFLRVGPFSFVSIIPPMLRLSRIFKATFNRRTNGTILQTFKQNCGYDAFFFFRKSDRKRKYTWNIWMLLLREMLIGFCKRYNESSVSLQGDVFLYQSRDLSVNQGPCSVHLLSCRSSRIVFNTD
jgi:hypothetical protein